MSPRSSPSTTRRALVGGCASLTAALAGCSRLESTVPDLSSTADPDDWPQRYRDLGNTNASPEAPNSLTERWSRRIESRLDRPVVVDGTVFTVAIGREGSVPVRVLAVDAETGADRWTLELSGVRRARIAAVVDETVYVVGERLEGADGERLYAIDADDAVSWSFDAERISAVAAAGPTVLASVRHGSIVALDAEDGSTLSRLHPAGLGRRWLSDLVPAGRPAILGGTVFAPFARYDPDREDSYFEERIVAFDGDGLAWTRSVGDVRFLDEVTAVDGTVYALTTDRRGGLEGPAASLTALDSDSGARRWRRSIDGGVSSVLTARDDLAVVTGRDAIAFDAQSGEQRWRNGVFSGPPVIAGDRVYGRGTEGEFVDTIVAADLETGERTASHTFDHQLNRAPVFAHGRAIARTLEYERGDGGPEHVADRLHALW